MDRTREDFDKDLIESSSISNCFPTYDSSIDRSSAGRKNVQDLKMCFQDSAKLIQLNYPPQMQCVSPVQILLSGLIF